MTHSSPPAVPDGFDFDPAFLRNKDFLPERIDSHGSPLLGPSRRCQCSDLTDWFRLDKAPKDVLERTAHTIALSGVHVVVDDRERRRHDLLGMGRLVFPEEHLNRHLLFVGPPGVGKTTQGILPLVAELIADQQRSVVVFDPKGDLFGVVRELAAKAGRSRRSVRRLNLTDPQGSIGWNPLRTGMSRTEAHGIATSLVMAVESKHSHDSPYWRNTSIELITGIVLGLVNDPDEQLTLPRVTEILDLPRKRLLEWLHEHGVHKFGGFLESGSHNAETCLSDTSMRLVSLLDLDLCAVLSHGELRLDRLFTEPQVLVVEMDEARLDRLRPVFNVLVQQILDRGIEAASKRPDARLPFPVSLVIDEFGSAIGAIPRFPTYLNTLRSRRIGVIAAVQSLSQIHALYGNEAGAVLVGFSSKVFFPNVEWTDAEFVSLASGTMTVQAPSEPGVPPVFLSHRVYLPEEVARPRAHPVLGRPVTMMLADGPPLQAYLARAHATEPLRTLLLERGKKRTRPRRKHPLRYERDDAVVVEPPKFTDTRSATDTLIQRWLAEAERRWALPSAPLRAQRLWERLRSAGLRDGKVALRFVEELLHRSATPNDLLEAQLGCRAAAPSVLLKYLDFRLELRREGATELPQAELADDGRAGTAEAS